MEIFIGQVMAILFVLPIYFLPTLVARNRSHPNQKLLATINIFLGFTFIAWVALLVWAFSAIKHCCIKYNCPQNVS